MRLFVAVFPPPEVSRAVLASARRLLGESSDRFRWVPPENVHLTLKFIGEVEAEAVTALGAALAAVGGRHRPFDVRPSGLLGAFPSERRAQVLWAALGAGSDPLAALAADVEGALEPLGFAGERRPFKAHLTLGRAKGRPPKLDLPRDPLPLPGFRAERFGLVESRLGPGGARYEELRGYALGSVSESG